MATSDPRALRPESWLVSAGRPDAPGEPLNTPLVAASTFAIGTGRDYSRNDGTPTWEALETILGGLEEAHAVVFASGMAAVAAVFDQLRAGVSTGPHRRFVTSAAYAAGDFYDGEISTVSTSVEWIPVPRFRAMLAYDYNDVELPQGDFVVRLARAGLDVIMSAKLSWVNLVQYDNASRTTGVNSRLHWIPDAGRELFIVLNHNLEDFDRDGRNHSDFADFTIKYRHTFRY